MNKSEIEITNNIEEFGCHVMSVFDPEGEDIDFTYTIGINKRQNQPELIIIGLRHKLAASIANEYNRHIQSGKTFKSNVFYGGFIDGFKVVFCPVSREYKQEYMLSCNRLYNDTDYPALQLIYPTVKGVWPWEKKATEGFKLLQPSLQEIPTW
jgi:hypothetical protein